MEVKVTKAHFNAGVKAASNLMYFDVNTQCPIAQAIRAAKPGHKVNVYGELVEIQRGKAQTSRLRLSKNGVTLINRFDKICPILSSKISATTKKRLTAMAARLPITVTLVEYVDAN